MHSIDRHLPLGDARQLARLLSFVLLLTLLLTAVMSFQLSPNRLQLRDGEVAPQTIKSPARVTYVSQLRTQEERDQAAAHVADVIKYDPSVMATQLAKLTDVINRIGAARDNPLLSPDQKAGAAAKAADGTLPADLAKQSVTLTPGDWQAVGTEASRLVREVMKDSIGAQDLSGAQDRVSQLVKLQGTPALLASGLAVGVLRPNAFPDTQATDAARQRAADEIAPVRVTVERGETILRDGQIVSSDDLEKLAAVGLLGGHIQWEEVLGLGLLALGLSTALGLYVACFLHRMLQNDRRLLLLVLLVAGAVLCMRIFVPGRDVYMYAVPVAAVPMLISTLLDTRLAIVASALLALLGGYLAGESLEFAVVAFLAGMTGTLGVWRAQRMNRYFLTGALISLVVFGATTAFQFLAQDYGLSQLGSYALISAIHGVLAAALTVGTFTILGHIFGITTTIHLLELADPSQPLLRRLLTEAPGTYYHSLIVANLSERAAQVIDAEPLLVRVGAYYHDIGKLNRPSFFAENQFDYNIHDFLEPGASAEMILAHVADGLDLAKRHRLPSRVVEIIAQHHGTRLVTFFYHRACQQLDNVDAQDYRYAGPRPQTREAAIVMLADSIEAMVRSSKEHSQEQIEELVDTAVMERLMEGELGECDLTLRDLTLMREAFKDVLRGVFHPRIKYPDTGAVPLRPSPSAALEPEKPVPTGEVHS